MSLLRRAGGAFSPRERQIAVLVAIRHLETRYAVRR